MAIRSWLTELFRRLTTRIVRFRPRHRRSNTYSVTPAILETLEPRRLLSASAVGPETLVNTYTSGTQETNRTGAGGSIAMDADGNYVITWSSSGEILGLQTGQDGSGYGIYAQRYNAAGVALGGEFRVNTYTAGDQRYSTVAMDANGNFVVTWTSLNQDDGGLFGGGVYAQRYNAAGVAQGAEFRVNTTETGMQWKSTVAMDTGGDFVVTWSSYGTFDGSGYGIYAQRYNAAGVAMGGEFRVDTYTAGDQLYSTVAMDAAGDFVVTWSSFGQDGGGSGGWGVYAQRYNTAGVAQGTEFRVNTTEAGDQRNSTVAMDADGDFVVSWVSSDGSGGGVYAQRYNTAGVAQGAEFRVNTYTTDNQGSPTVAMDAAGDFVVTWSSLSQDVFFTYGVYAQQYNVAGVPQGSEFRQSFTT